MENAHVKKVQAEGKPPNEKEKYICRRQKVKVREEGNTSKNQAERLVTKENTLNSRHLLAGYYATEEWESPKTIEKHDKMKL